MNIIKDIENAVDYQPLKTTHVDKYRGVLAEGYCFLSDGTKDECVRIDRDEYELRFEFPDEDIHVAYNKESLEALKRCIEATLILP